MHWQQEGEEPDYRFSLANERTFLAWIRTALAVLAGGILLHQFADRIQPRGLLLVLTVSLCCLSAILGGGAYLRWKGNEIAMRHRRALPRSLLLPVLALAILLLSIVIALIVLLT
jgi:putative membrane protein